jgi:hypothetical protein
VGAGRIGEGSIVDDARSEMPAGIWSLGISQIREAKDDFVKHHISEDRPAEVRPA